MKKVILNGVIEENCYIVEKDNDCFLIDPGSDYETLIKELGSLNVKFILLTHGHMDHIDLIGFFHVPIYIHSEDAIMLKDSKLALYDELRQKPSYFYKNLDIHYTTEKIIFHEEEIIVYHTPGHTKGSVCYQYKNKLFCGDTIFKCSVGRTDLPGGNASDMENSVLYILDNLDERIKLYPGHDENTTIKEEKQNNPYYLYYKKH